MIYTILISIIVASLITILFFVYMTYRSVKNGEIEVIQDDKNIKLFIQYLLMFYKFILKKINKSYKFTTQYALHIIVRLLYFINIVTDKIYARSRDTFVKSATKNKYTVTHFWSHLKVYKREIDKEKAE